MEKERQQKRTVTRTRDLGRRSAHAKVVLLAYLRNLANRGGRLQVQTEIYHVGVALANNGVDRILGRRRSSTTPLRTALAAKGATDGRQRVSGLRVWSIWRTLRRESVWRLGVRVMRVWVLLHVSTWGRGVRRHCVRYVGGRTRLLLGGVDHYIASIRRGQK